MNVLDGVTHVPGPVPVLDLALPALQTQDLCIDLKFRSVSLQNVNACGNS